MRISHSTDYHFVEAVTEKREPAVDISVVDGKVRVLVNLHEFWFTRETLSRLLAMLEEETP